jgi:hypothetical protein
MESQIWTLLRAGPAQEQALAEEPAPLASDDAVGRSINVKRAG